MVFLHLLSYSNLGISLISLFLHPLLLVMVFHCFLLLFLILLPFLHLLVISILQMFLHSPTIFWIPSSLLVSGSGLSDAGSPKTIIFFLLFCLSLSSISLSFSDFWITSSTFVLVPVIVDHGLSSLSSPPPPPSLILFSIFSILLL